jgi:NAD(P)H-quinone oxidoreductase subunit 5
MQPILPDLTPLRAALLCAVPALYLLAALAPGLLARTPKSGWLFARAAATLAVAASALSLAWLVVAGAALAHGPELLSLDEMGTLQLSLRSDALGTLMLLLVSFIGWVIVGYSQPYLDGERGQPRYICSLMLTLAAVSLLVMTNNLLLLALAWIVTSLALHGLLTFFSDRPQALIAAHKKFLASRVADLCLLSAIALVGSQLGTLEIDQAIAAAKALPEIPGALQAAALLFVVSALLKCAQLPVHGWLIQVMEAPTPVSALLHAGVVNLGGFMLIRLGTLVTDVPAAQALLVAVGAITAVVAALVMMTRIGIKVCLAWSTCAQMGFMLMQCGLGLYDLALLHIVAHSLYKAYAFLSAGGAVEQNRLQQMTPAAPPMGAGTWLLGALVGLGLVALAALAWGIHPADAPALWAVGGILAFALAPLLAGPALRAGGAWPLAGLGVAFAVALVYFGLHLVFSRWLGVPASTPNMALIALVLGCFAVLFVVQGAVRAHPQGALARSLYPWLFAGLYLDEVFTRLTFRVWPARLPEKSTAPLQQPALSEARNPGAL